MPRQAGTDPNQAERGTRPPRPLLPRGRTTSARSSTGAFLSTYLASGGRFVPTLAWTLTPTLALTVALTLALALALTVTLTLALALALP